MCLNAITELVWEALEEGLERRGRFVRISDYRV
jgi:hypothetical protein